MTGIDGVSPLFAEALAKQGYTTLTEVQRAVLAPNVGEADLLVSAQTGSGKTVAFGLAMASTLLGGKDRFPESSDPLAVVVAPTRELAVQVRLELEWVYAPAGARMAACVGGMDMRQERRALANGAHIVVGTPGRLRDHITRGSLDMSSVRALVLDEADEMLDLGFREDLEFILKAAPPERRTLLFSATVPKPIETLAKRFQKNAIRISANKGTRQHADIDYRAIAVASRERENAVINVLRYFDAGSALVFCATREGVKHLASRLGNRGFGVVALSGELSQHRTHAGASGDAGWPRAGLRCNRRGLARHRFAKSRSCRSCRFAEGQRSAVASKRANGTRGTSGRQRHHHAAQQAPEHRKASNPCGNKGDLDAGSERRDHPPARQGTASERPCARRPA